MTQTRQKSYADVRRRELEFDVDDWVYLKITPMKAVIKFGKKGKMSPHYIIPYKISRRFSTVAYKLDLPSDLALVHSMFRVLLWKKFIGDHTLVIPRERVGLMESLSYE